MGYPRSPKKARSDAAPSLKSLVRSAEALLHARNHEEMIPMQLGLHFMLEGLVDAVPEHQRLVVIDFARSFRLIFSLFSKQRPIRQLYKQTWQ